ncbi:MAG: hypothetical protein M0T73_17285 [Deltaproteobacteria bacterium]|nr:hypothetical protein [Deltaproteobacteria bacterium]
MKLDGASLTHDEAFEALVEAGYQVVQTDFDEMAFREWRQKAINCIATLLGAEHPYTRSFSEYVLRRDLNSLFLGRGLVYATKRDVLMDADQNLAHLENN